MRRAACLVLCLLAGAPATALAQDEKPAGDGAGVEAVQPPIGGGDKDPLAAALGTGAAVVPDRAAGDAEQRLHGARGNLRIEMPVLFAGGGIEREDLGAARAEVEHVTDLERRVLRGEEYALVGRQVTRAVAPHLLQPSDIGRRDLRSGRIALAEVGAAIGAPLLGAVREFRHRGGWHGRGRCHGRWCDRAFPGDHDEAHDGRNAEGRHGAHSPARRGSARVAHADRRREGAKEQREDNPDASGEIEDPARKPALASDLDKRPSQGDRARRQQREPLDRPWSAPAEPGRDDQERAADDIHHRAAKAHDPHAKHELRYAHQSDQQQHGEMEHPPGACAMMQARFGLASFVGHGAPFPTRCVRRRNSPRSEGFPRVFN